MQEAVGSLKLQWQDRPEGAEAAYRQFLAVQRRRRPEAAPELEVRLPPIEPGTKPAQA